MRIETIGDFYELAQRIEQKQWEVLVHDLVFVRKVHSISDNKDVLRKYFLPEYKARTSEHIKKLMKERGYE